MLFFLLNISSCENYSVPSPCYVTAELRERLLQRKTGLRPQYFITDRSNARDASVVISSYCQCSFALYLSLTYCSVYLE